MPAYLEVPGALESLRARGLKLGVLAQTSAGAADAVLRFAGLRDRLELVLSAQDAGAYKPDPRPYRMAIEQTGVDRERGVHGLDPLVGRRGRQAGRPAHRRGSPAANARCSTPSRARTTPAATSPRWLRGSLRACRLTAPLSDVCRAIRRRPDYSNPVFTRPLSTPANRRPPQRPARTSTTSHRARHAAARLIRTTSRGRVQDGPERDPVPGPGALVARSSAAYSRSRASASALI